MDHCYDEKSWLVVKIVQVASSNMTQIGIFIFPSDRRKQTQMAVYGEAFSFQRVFTQAFMLSKTRMNIKPLGSVRTTKKMKWKPGCLQQHPTGNSQQPFKSNFNKIQSYSVQLLSECQRKEFNNVLGAKIAFCIPCFFYLFSSWKYIQTFC